MLSGAVFLRHREGGEGIAPRPANFSIDIAGCDMINP